MAKKNTVEYPIDLVSLFVSLVEFDSTEDNPTTAPEIAEEFGISTGEAREALGRLEDIGLIDAESARGAWITFPDVSIDNAEQIVREALAEFQPVESSTGLSREDIAKEVRRVKLEVLKENGEGVPDKAAFYKEKAEEIKEAFARAHEITHGVTHETTHGIVHGTERTPLPENQFSDSVVVSSIAPHPYSWFRKVYPSGIDKRNERLEEPEYVPPLPGGVQESVWDHAHNSDTQSARDWWMARAISQIAVYELTLLGQGIED